MFIGEAPGAREAKLRKPFVGLSGEFLNEMLASVGIERSEVFITNVVKYRPLSNRDPEDAEVWAGIPYLRMEHRILGRPPMVFLGRHARNTLTGQLKGHPVGKWFWAEMDGGFPVLPLHHPAYGIYQKSNRPMMMQQFQAVLRVPASKEECDAAV
jgi:uracil-DNA glycosylase family 4